MNVYKQVWPVSLDHPTLAMIGFFDLVGSICVGTELQARWATSMFIGQARPLPSREVMMGIVNQTREEKRAAFGIVKWKVQTHTHTERSFVYLY